MYMFQIHPIVSMLAIVLGVCLISPIPFLAFPKIRQSFKGHRFHWQYLGRLFHPVAVRLLVPWFAILPILLNVFADAPETLQLQIGKESITISTSLPFKWYLLWLASFFYTIAWTIYLLRSPRFVRHYPNLAAYREEQHSPRWVIHEVEKAASRITKTRRKRLLRKLIDKGYAVPIVNHHGQEGIVIEENETANYFILDGTAHRIALGEFTDNHETVEREIFWEVFEQYASNNPVWRMLCAELVLATAVFFSIAVIQNILTVIAIDLRM